MSQTLTQCSRSSQFSTRTGCSLTVRVLVHGPTHVTLELDGECDLASADLITAVVTDQIRTGRRAVRIDLAAVSFLDAAGLRAIVEARNELLSHHGRLELQRAGRQITRLLSITRLDTVLTVVPDADDRTGQ